METGLLEQQLIERCRKGDQKAFSELIKTYRRQLFTYLWKIIGGDRMQAEDLFQETLIKAWQGIPKYRHDDRFSSWLFSIAHNVAMDGLRKNRIRSCVVVTDELFVADYQNPYTELADKELRGIIDEAIGNLPEKQKRVFLLREHGEMSFKEIAELTSEPLNTVLGHMHYAVEKVKKALRIKHAI